MHSYLPDRRQFLKSVAKAPALLAVGSLAPQFLLSAAESKDGHSDRILVVIQLSGGNDGLNTLVPYTHDEYYKHRKTLAVPPANVLKVNDQFGWHPAIRGFADLLESSELAVVQGVGYPNPNRSHFESMDIWHTCVRKSESRKTGWLGRYADHLLQEQTADTPAIHLGHQKQPLALAASVTPVPSVQSLEQFQLKVSGDESTEVIRNLAVNNPAPSNDLLGFVQSSTSTAIKVSDQFKVSSKEYSSSVPYPESSLGDKLKTVARLIDAGLSTRIYYVELDGFDTHSNQAAAHESLLRQLGDAVSAFTRDVSSHGHGNRVLTMCFSEFGRRVAENASEGTDHGAAAPMFLAGSQVKSGIIGNLPSLTDLDRDGDLKFHTDFRSIYATVLKHWLECPADQILAGTYPTLPLLSN